MIRWLVRDGEEPRLQYCPFKYPESVRDGWTDVPTVKEEPQSVIQGWQEGYWARVGSTLMLCPKGDGPRNILSPKEWAVEAVVNIDQPKAVMVTREKLDRAIRSAMVRVFGGFPGREPENVAKFMAKELGLED